MDNPNQLRLMPDLGGQLSVNPAHLATYAFYTIVLFVLIYTFVAAYHWFRYGHRSVVAIPAIALHVFVSLGLVGFAASGL